MHIIVLASGSKGNAIYIETTNAKVLFDAGISLKQIKSRLSKHNIDFNDLDAVFISHEHSDHTKHIVPILEKTNASLFINQVSFDYLGETIKTKIINKKIFFIDKERKYSINDIIVVPIELSHDSKNIFGFLIKAENENIGIITDTGIVPEKYFSLLKKMNILFFESNHDIDMLLNSSRPWHLKQRILSPHGHLSNEECAKVLSQIISNDTKCIILSHLSEECNNPNLAYNVNSLVLANTNIKLLVAGEDEEISILEELAA
jgi:phosphoribosyl 1,2-cyclic phosphodiesterase